MGLSTAGAPAAIEAQASLIVAAPSIGQTGLKLRLSGHGQQRDTNGERTQDEQPYTKE